MIEKLNQEEDGVWTDEHGHAYSTKKEYLQTELLGLCGCGDPYIMMIYIRDYLSRLDENRWLKYEDLAYMFFVYWANDKEFAEHGTTVRCSWLTKKGKELLADINWCIVNEKEEE